MKKFNCKTTIFACFTGYVVQAIVNNFVPLLFLTFQNTYEIALGQITLLVTFNFGIQLLVDLLAGKYVDKIGYRTCIVFAHMMAAVGLLFLTILPEVMDPFAGILIAVCIYAVGGGLIEVLISPIMESCPTDNKEKAMSLLHSFYCFGHVGVVLLSTVFFKTAGVGNWKILSLLWTVIPLVNGIVFVKTPMAPLYGESEKGMNFRELFSCKAFWVFVVMMVCAGAGEQAVSQWSSFFAERGLGISKTMGDLAGPMMFAVFMGTSRAIYGKFGEKMDLNRFMKYSCSLCILSYLLICFAPFPALALAGCGLCGFSVGIMWPGTFSKAAKTIKRGGTAMFAFLALAGDLGCMGGPTLVGMISDMMGDNLKMGILSGILFPILLFICLLSSH